MAGFAFRQKPKRGFRARRIVHACVRRRTAQRKIALGPAAAGPLTKQGRREQPDRRSQAKILSAPAACHLQCVKTTKLAPPRLKTAWAMRCTSGSGRSARFGKRRPSGPQGQATPGALSATRPPCGRPRLRLPFFPFAWPRVTCTKSGRRQWRRRSRQRSRREPRCQSTRFEPSLACVSRMISRSGPACAWSPECHVPTRSAPDLPRWPR